MYTSGRDKYHILLLQKCKNATFFRKKAIADTNFSLAFLPPDWKIFPKRFSRVFVSKSREIDKLRIHAFRMCIRAFSFR